MEYVKQNQIANQLHVSESFFSRIVSGKRQCPPVVAKLLSVLTSSEIEIWLFSSQKNIESRKGLIKTVTQKALDKLMTKTDRGEAA